MHTSKIITAVEAHAEGEPGRVITAGLPPIPGDTVYDKMRWMEAHLDDIRLLMLREPRGHPALCCNAIVPPGHPDADAGFIIMEQTEYPPMSGSNAMCTVTALLETGILPMAEPITELTLEAPAGLLRVKAHCRNGKVTKVEFRNVPAFATHLDVPLEVPGHGTVTVDIAWGGMFFVLANANQFGIEIAPENGADMVRVSEAMRQAAAERYPVVHPENNGITGPTISHLVGPASDGADGTSAVTVSTGSFDPARPNDLTGVLDRSPCGTGTCAKIAVLHAKGLLQTGDTYINRGPMGTTFTVQIVEETQVGPYPAIVPSLSGQAWIYGISQHTLDPSDPFPTGYKIGDIWGA